MSCVTIRLALLGSCVVALATLATAPASAQALRSPSASSVAAGATADRNSLSTPATPGLPSATARQSVSTGTGSPSRYSVLGVPLRVAAPVNAPYNDNFYGTFAGQPTSGKDAVIQQSIDGAP